MSDIDTYLTQIFGKIDRPRTNIPNSLNSIKLFLKGMRQIFDAKDSEAYVGSAIFAEQVPGYDGTIPYDLTYAMTVLAIPEFVKDSVFSASNFDDFKYKDNVIPLRETVINPQWGIILAQVLMAAYDTMMKTNQKTPGSYEILVRRILDIKTDDKHIKTLQRCLMIFFERSGPTVSFTVNGNVLRLEVAEKIAEAKSEKARVKAEAAATAVEKDHTDEKAAAAAAARAAHHEALGKLGEATEALGTAKAKANAEADAKAKPKFDRVKAKYRKMMGGAVFDNREFLDLIEPELLEGYTSKDAKERFPVLLQICGMYIDHMIASDFPTQTYLTSYNIDKALSSILKPVPPTKSNFFNDETTGRNFVRKSDGKSSILYEIKNGKETIVNEDQITRRTSHESAGVRDTPNTKGKFHDISEYYSQCLTGTLKDSEGRCFDIDFVSAPNDLDKMDVSTLKLIRKQFQIPSEDVIDEVSGSRVTKLKSYDEWLKVVEASVDAQKLTTIKGNRSLRTYIEILISYFNTHLQILNPGYKVDVDISTFLNRQSPLGLAKILYRANNISIISKYSQADLINIARQAEYNLGSLKSQNSLNGIQGGGSGDINLPNLINPVAELLRSQMFEIVRSLNEMGKEILPKDFKEIEDRLDDLQSRESKLIQLYKYISEYHDLLRLKGPQTDSALILSIDNLKKFIDLYKEKQSKVLQKQLQSTSLMEAVTKVL